MAKIIEYKDLPLGDLVIGKGQVRTQDPGKDVDKLAESIEKQGLLQPIVVCEAAESGKWEILTGQRRFLAHRMLKKSTITAAVLDERVDEAEAKAISITENLIRRSLSGTELIDGITFLYNKYGSAKAVHEMTGIPYDDVRHYVKYPRLMAPLRELVDEGKVDIKVALKAQDAVEVGDDPPKSKDAVTLALEMNSMSDAQRRKLVKERQDKPETTIADSIEQARTGSKITQMVVTLTSDSHGALQRFAKDQDVTQDEAAAGFIVEGLVSRGLLEG
jgi:ParB family chromosome partitioning protein